MGSRKTRVRAVVILAALAGVSAAAMFWPQTRAILTGHGPTELPQNPNGNFVLVVSNQSLAVDPVDIRISLDGKVAVNQRFRVGHQHSWYSFRFLLPKGKHRIVAESRRGEARLEKEFEVEGKHWALVEFWYDPSSLYGQTPTPKQFSFHLMDRPPRFS